MNAINEVVFDVDGLAPGKGEALSMLGAGHSHRPRVEALLTAAHEAAGESNCPLGDSLVGLELLVRRPAGARLMMRRISWEGSPTYCSEIVVALLI